MNSNDAQLTILQVITPRHFSGAERMVVHLSKGLHQRGHRVVVACKPNEQLQEALQAADIEVHPLAISGKLNVLAPFRIAELARRIGAQVIHTHLSSASLWGSVAGRLAGIPVVAEVHALNTSTCYRLAHQVVTCSHGVREHLIRQRMDGSRIAVLYNGLPPEDFTNLRPPATLREELGLPPSAPVIGVVGHLAPKKGHQCLLRALPAVLEHFPDLLCLIVGDGPQRARLEALGTALGVDHALRFTGFRPDARDLMGVMQTVVLPSVAKEGLGIVLLEAGFLAKPVIGSDIPGIDEVIVPNETGLLFPAGNHEALAECILRILHHPDQAYSMGEKGCRRAHAEFTAEQMTRRAEQLYITLISRLH